MVCAGILCLSLQQKDLRRRSRRKTAEPVERSLLSQRTTAVGWDNVGEQEIGDALVGVDLVFHTGETMETFGESYGYIRYRTTVTSAASGDLVLPALRSYARVYVNWVLVGTLNRQKKEDRINVRVNAKDELDVIIEGTGRINFSLELRNERQGINGPVMLAGKELTGWEVLPLPMDDLSALHYGPILSRPRPANGPAFYQGHFDLHEIGDTFLDTRGWGKGVVWINGHALGRFWNIGPQQTLYVPAPYLKQGKNEVIVFTLGGKTLRLRGLREPILDELGSE